MQSGSARWLRKLPNVEVFARMLAAAGVERLVDVHELPISRRRGFPRPRFLPRYPTLALNTYIFDPWGTPRRFAIYTSLATWKLVGTLTNSFYYANDKTSFATLMHSFERSLPP